MTDFDFATLIDELDLAYAAAGGGNPNVEWNDAPDLAVGWMFGNGRGWWCLRPPDDWVLNLIDVTNYEDWQQGRGKQYAHGVLPPRFLPAPAFGWGRCGSEGSFTIRPHPKHLRAN